MVLPPLQFSTPINPPPTEPALARYSPRDFISDDLEDYEAQRLERDGGGSCSGSSSGSDPHLLGLDVPAGAVPRIRGRISLRMLAQNNLWYSTWSESKPVSAANQKPIFDAVKEAEMVPPPSPPALAVAPCHPPPPPRFSTI